MQITPWVFLLHVILLLQCGYTSSTTTSSPLMTNPPNCICVNGGTCRESDENLEGSGNLLCDCAAGFTGMQCETRVTAYCGSDVCTEDEQCVQRSNDSVCENKDTPAIATIPPRCVRGPHQLTYNLKMRDVPVVCLNTYEYNSSSLCYDNDSSITFSVGDQDVRDFFSLVMNYQTLQTCLKVNNTFTPSNFPQGAVQNVTLIAKENEFHKQSANITFTVTFNTPPNATFFIRNYAVNKAVQGRQLTIDVPVDFGVSDRDILTFSLTGTNSPHRIDPSTGSLNVTLGNRIDEVIKIKIQDDGVPRLATEVTVNVKVLYFNCNETARQLYVDINNIGGSAVGKIECVLTAGFMFNTKYNQPEGIELDISSNNLILVRNGTRGTYFIRVTLTIPFNISVNIDIKIIIAIETIPPRCVRGPHQLTYNFKMRDVPVVCLNTYEYNSSSLCYDNDSSITFSVGDQDVRDFFSLVMNNHNQQTCLKVNNTFTSSNFPQGAVQNVTLIAKENEFHKQSANITFTVTFNTPPNATFYIRNYAVNKAVQGRQLTIDVPVDFGVSDRDILTFSLTGTNSSHRIDPTTGSLNVTLGNRIDEVIKIKIQDDGVPRLATEVTVNIKVLYFNCNETARQLYVDINNIGGSAVGKIECVLTAGFMFNTKYNQPEGIQLHISSNNLILVRNGTRGTYFIRVTLTMPFNISVNIDIKITIGDLITGVFRMTNKTWIPDLADTSSSAFLDLKTSVENEVTKELNSTDVKVNVVQFRPGSVWAYYTLLAQDKANLTMADRILNASAENGFIGVIPVGSYESFDGVGLILSTEVVYNNSVVGNTPNVTVNTTRVELTCEWFILLQVGEVTIEWRMLDRNALIIPVQNSRLQILTTRPALGQYITTLTIDPILSKDSGPFTCTLIDQGGHSDSGRLPIRVIAPPVLTLMPIRQAFMNTTDSVTLVCNVTEPRNVFTNITWFIDGNSSKTEITTTSRLTVLGSSTPNITYYCRGSNRAGDGSNSTVTTVFILPPEIKQCDEDGIWPKTKAEEMSETFCTNGENGIMTRKCNDSGDWLPVDRSQCVSQSLQSVIDDVEYIAEGVQVSNLSTVAKNLSDTTKPKDLETKEIILVLDTVNVVLETAKTTNLTEDKNETLQLAEGLTNTISNTIDEQAVGQWNYSAQDNSTNTPSQALDAVDTVTELVSESLEEGEEFKVESPNIVLQVTKTDPNQTQTIVFPDESDDTSNTNVTSSVKLEAATIKALSGNQSISYSSIYYKNISALLPGVADRTTANSTRVVNSGVWGINIFPPPTKILKPPLLLNFTHTNKTINDPNKFCGYLDTTNNTWLSDGCRPTGGTLNYTLCSCDHLTNFAILMRPYEPEPTPDPDLLSSITIIGCSISVVCLTLTVIIYITVWKYVKSDQAIILMNICVFLGVAMLLFMLGVDRQEKTDVACKAVAMFLHLFFLLAFFMMLAAGLEALWTIEVVFSSRSKVKPLLIGGWVLPVVIVAVSVGGTQFRGYGGKFYCWLSTGSGLIWAFAGPVLLVVLVNCVIIGKLLHKLLTTRSIQNKQVHQKVKKALRGMCILIPLFGVSWVFGVLAVNEKAKAFQYIFTILNSFQGVFIFITQCAMKRKVQKGLKNYHRQLMSSLMLSNDLRTSQRRDVSRERGRLDSYHNLLQTQSTSEGAAQQSSNERIQPGYQAPDSPYTSRVDVHRLGDTQETMVPDDPPTRMLSTELGQVLRNRRPDGTYHWPIAEEERQSTADISCSLVSRQRPGRTHQWAVPEDSPQRILSPEQGSHLLPSDTYQRNVSPLGFRYPEHSPQLTRRHTPNHTYQRDTLPQGFFSPEHSFHLTPKHRPHGIYQRDISSHRFLTPEYNPQLTPRYTQHGTYRRDILPHEFLSPEHSPKPTPRHTPHGTYQRDILPHEFLSPEHSPKPTPRHTPHGTYQRDILPHEFLSPEHSPKPTPRHTPHGTYERDILPYGFHFPEHSPQLTPRHRQRDTNLRDISAPGFISSSPRVTPRHTQHGTNQQANLDDADRRMLSSGIQGQNDIAYQWDRCSASSLIDLFFDFTQEAQQTHYQRDVSNDPYTDDIKDIYGSGMPNIQEDNNPFGSGGHLYTTNNPYHSAFADNDPYDNFFYRRQPPLPRSSPGQNLNVQHSLPEDEALRSPFYQLMQDGADMRSISPRVHDDNRSLQVPSPNPFQDHHERHLRQQRSRNTSEISSGQPRLDFVPVAVRADTRHVSGSTGTSPFLHPDMLGTTSVGDQLIRDAPFSAFRPFTPTLRRRDSNT